MSLKESLLPNTPWPSKQSPLLSIHLLKEKSANVAILKNKVNDSGGLTLRAYKGHYRSDWQDPRGHREGPLPPGVCCVLRPAARACDLGRWQVTRTGTRKRSACTFTLGWGGWKDAGLFSGQRRAGDGNRSSFTIRTSHVLKSTKNLFVYWHIWVTLGPMALDSVPDIFESALLAYQGR